MRIIGRLGRVLFGWLNLGVNSLESKNVDALIASLEDEKSKAEQEIYERLVAVKTTVNNMTKNVKSLKQKVQVLNERAILAMKTAEAQGKKLEAEAIRELNAAMGSNYARIKFFESFKDIKLPSMLIMGGANQNDGLFKVLNIADFKPAGN